MDAAEAPPWLWIALTLVAALATTIRNASQRHLERDLGELWATLARFLYALPFALIWLLVALATTRSPLPVPGWTALLWIAVASIAQIGATVLLLRVMAERNFALGVAYSNTQVLQVAIFAAAILGDPITLPAALALAAGTAGVFLLSPVDANQPLRALLRGFASRAARLGLACGALFGLTSVAFRGAALSMPEVPYIVIGAYTLVAAQLAQTLLLGSWLLSREPRGLVRALNAWRVSLLAGAMGAAATAAWNTAYAIEPVAHVRTLGLVELLFSYAVSHRIFRERLSATEMLGMALVGVGVATIALSGKAS